MLPSFLRMKQSFPTKSSQEMMEEFGHTPLWVMAAKKVPFLSEWKLANAVASKMGLLWAATWGICALTRVSLPSYGI